MEEAIRALLVTWEERRKEYLRWAIECEELRNAHEAKGEMDEARYCDNVSDKNFVSEERVAEHIDELKAILKKFGKQELMKEEK